MPDLPFATIGFDLDGTLLETHRDLGAAVNHALALGGFEPVPADHASDKRKLGHIPVERFRTRAHVVF